MCDVTNVNFESKFGEIEKAIRSADFIAFDAEFTGLDLDGNTRGSLFDVPSARYAKVRDVVKKCTVTQFGLCTFRCVSPSQYEFQPYNFYLFPRHFGCLDTNFTCNAATLEFLAHHKFDFNKFVNEGVSYMNGDQLARAKSDIDASVFTNDKDSDANRARVVQRICSKVSRWFARAKVGDVYTVEKLEDDMLVPNSILHRELLVRFSELWPISSSDEYLAVKRVTTTERESMVAGNTGGGDGDSVLLNSMLGFSRLINVLISSHCPIVGHNAFYDLLYMYEKFTNPLPENYCDFKSQIHSLFPTIVDTKHLLQLCKRQQLLDSSLLRSTGLEAVYTELTGEYESKPPFYPEVRCSPCFSNKYESEKLCHEAGFDAYMTGCVFLQISHVFASKNSSLSEPRPLQFDALLSAVDGGINCVNLFKARVSHLNLVGDDPASMKPEHLLVRHKLGQPLHCQQLAMMFSPMGSVDVKPTTWSRAEALVATGNNRCANDILRAFKKNPTLLITRYSFWRHNPKGKACLWFGLAAFGSLAMFSIWDPLTRIRIRRG